MNKSYWGNNILGEYHKIEIIKTLNIYIYFGLSGHHHETPGKLYIYISLISLNDEHC